MTHTCALGVILLLLGAPAMLAQAGLAKPVIGKLPSGGASVVNTGPSRWADTNGWKLVYERTVQPAEGERGGLENPWGTALASDGRLLTVDFKNPAIRLYGANGKFLRTLSRFGEGPGEFKVPFIALYHDSLYLYDPRLHRATVMTLNGKLVRTIATTVNDQYPLVFDARGMMALRASTWTRTSVTGHWIYHTRTGEKVDSIAALGFLDTKSWKFVSDEGPSSWGVPFPPSNVELLLPTGGAVIGRTDDYTLVITRTGSDTVRRFSRANPPRVRIPDSVRDSAVEANIMQNPRLRGIARVEDVPTQYPPWRSLALDAPGNIWVGARTERPGRMRYDVFSPVGAFLGSVAVPFAAGATVNFHGDRVAVIDTDGDDLPRIRIFRIDRRGK